MERVEVVLCRDCQDFRQEVKATRTIGTTAVCDEHWRNRLGQKFTAPTAPALTARELPEEKAMDRRASKLDAEAMQRDRDAGTRVTEIAKKHQCIPASVYNHTTGNGSGIKRAARRLTLAEKAAAALSTDARHGNRGRPKKADAARNGHANGSVPLLTVVATDKACDGMWDALSLEEKADLLNRLHEKD
jgi:hypothetical protein